jgi:hypothetical protein
MQRIALLDSGVWAAGFLKEDMFHAVADKLIARLLENPARARHRGLNE